MTFDEKSLYKDNFGEDSIERGWIGEKREMIRVNDVQAPQHNVQALNVIESSDLEDDPLDDLDYI